MHSSQIVILFLGPHVNDFARVLLGEAAPETVVLGDVLVARFELVERRFEDFDGALAGNDDLFVLAALGVKNDGFLASANDTVDALEDVVVDETEEDHSAAGIDSHCGRRLFVLVVQTRGSLLFLVRPSLKLVVNFVAQLHVEATAVANGELLEFHSFARVLPTSYYRVVLRYDFTVFLGVARFGETWRLFFSYLNTIVI